MKFDTKDQKRTMNNIVTFFEKFGVLDFSMLVEDGLIDIARENIVDDGPNKDFIILQSTGKI